MYRTYGDVGAACNEISFAYRSVPFFRERRAKGEFGPSAALQAHDLIKVPLTSKTDYRKHFPAGILVDGRSVNDPYVNRLQSSGTSGDRLVSVIHAFKLAERMANCVSLNRELGFLLDEPKIRTCRYAAPNCSDVECSNPNVPMEQRILQDGTLVLPVHHDLLTTPERMLQAAFEELHSYRPNIWYVDPMHLAFLIRKARESGWSFDVDRRVAVLLSYTMGTQALLRQLATLCKGHFPVVTVMGMSEFGFVGLDCHAGALHLNDKDYFLEFLALEEGGGSTDLWELVITSVGDRLCPHIRYRTHDVYRLLPRCECGHSMPAVSFEGRRKDLIQLASGRVVTPRDLDRVVGAPPFIDMFQLTYQRPSTFIFRYSGDAERSNAADMQALREGLEGLLESTSVRIELVKYFPFERGGKFQLIRTS
jgi:phenylacetate-CoA ligase